MASSGLGPSEGILCSVTSIVEIEYDPSILCCKDDVLPKAKQH